MSVRSAAPTISIIDINGEVNSFSENTLMDAYTQASSMGAHTIILNFSGLSYMNSSGIGLLVTLLIRTKRQNQRLLACGLSEHYRQIFELTRLNEAILVFDNEADAIKSAERIKAA